MGSGILTAKPEAKTHGIREHRGEFADLDNDALDFRAGGARAHEVDDFLCYREFVHKACKC